MPETLPKVLSLLGCYRPGHFATGPNQSFRAFAAGLGNEFDIRVVSSDPTRTCDNIWHNDGVSRIRQLRKGMIAARGLRKILRETPHDLLLLNGFNDREFTIPTLLLRKLGLVPRTPVILSPRGEFANGALSLKSGRKRAWLSLVRTLGLTHDVWFHATAPHEKAAIEALNLPTKGILEAPNARALPEAPSDLQDLRPTDGPLKLVFLGRVSPVKNLHYALEVLARIQSPVRFDVFGPSTEPDYLSRLETMVARLPQHVVVTFRGSLPHTDVPSVLSGYDLFFLPTLGENFGHAINEALAAGLPVLISDTTPWRGLEAAGAGWDLALDAPDRFAEAIDGFTGSSASTRRDVRRRARAFAERNFSESDALAANRRMLEQAMGMTGE